MASRIETAGRDPDRLIANCQKGGADNRTCAGKGQRPDKEAIPKWHES
jgi:hypothetical protein